MKKIYIGILGSIICAVSDVLLLYHPNLLQKYDGYQFLFDINLAYNRIGWMIGMIFIPLLYIGYKGVNEIGDVDSKKAMHKSDWVIIFLISLGCVVHSVYHFVPLFHNDKQLLTLIEINTIKLIEIMFVITYLLYCGIITVQSTNKKNKLLYANRFFNPLIWILLSAIITLANPQYGAYFAVSAFNVSIGFYFIGILINKKKII